MGKLPENILEYAFDKNWFRMFVPEEFGGENLSLSQGICEIYKAASIDGSLGWCINLGAGAGYFSGFLSDQACMEIFLNPYAAIAGSGMVGGNAQEVDDVFILNGKWDMCTGSAHATHFTVNAKTESGEVRSFIIPSNQINIEENWSKLGMINSSTCSIWMNKAIIPNYYQFDIGKIEVTNPGHIHRLEFYTFARYCMVAAFLGMLDSFAKKLRHIDAEMSEKIKSISNSNWNEVIDLAKKTDLELKSNDIYNGEKAIAEVVCNCTKSSFEALEKLPYQYGMELLDRQKALHTLYFDILVAGQHPLLR
ncbi:MAG: hypothetical protein JJU02_11900 [Cryomorphaceae bacterium]|nr:hypothetical protein [Cryomorphaceae bacterium]